MEDAAVVLAELAAMDSCCPPPVPSKADDRPVHDGAHDCNGEGGCSSRVHSSCTLQGSARKHPAPPRRRLLRPESRGYVGPQVGGRTYFRPLGRKVVLQLTLYVVPAHFINQVFVSSTIASASLPNSTPQQATSRSRSKARESRDFTVPSRTPNAAAVSETDSSEKKPQRHHLPLLLRQRRHRALDALALQRRNGGRRRVLGLIGDIDRRVRVVERRGVDLAASAEADAAVGQNLDQPCLERTPLERVDAAPRKHQRVLGQFLRAGVVAGQLVRGPVTSSSHTAQRRNERPPCPPPGSAGLLGASSIREASMARLACVTSLDAP